MLDIDRAQAHQLVAAPFVNNDVTVEALFRPTGEMPDKRCLGQIHKQVQMVGEFRKEIFIEVLMDRTTKH